MVGNGDRTESRRCCRVRSSSARPRQPLRAPAARIRSQRGRSRASLTPTRAAPPKWAVRMSAAGWFYVQDDKRLGPVDVDHIVHLVVTAALAPSALVWHHGLAEWTEANRVPELAALLPPPLPPGKKPVGHEPPPLPVRAAVEKHVEPAAGPPTRASRSCGTVWRRTRVRACSGSSRRSCARPATTRKRSASVVKASSGRPPIPPCG